MRLFAITSLLMLCEAFFAASAQNQDEKLVPVNLRVYFPQNVRLLEPSFRGNEQRLSDFVNKVEQALIDSSYRVDKIVIRSGASPEGPFDNNTWLSEERGIALREYLKYALNMPDSVFVLNPVGEDWEGFREMVLRYNILNRDKVVEIIDRYLAEPEKTAQLSTLAKLEIDGIDNGKTSDYIYRHIYPELRSSNNQVMCYFKKVVPQQTIINMPGQKDTLYMVSPDGMGPVAGAAAGTMADLSPNEPSSATAGEAAEKVARKAQRGRYRFAVKTNLLFDLAACPNIEVEFPIGKRVSLMAEHTFPWFVFGEDEYALEILNTGLECRIWLGKRKERSVLTGWFFGLYGNASRGDLEWQSKGCQSEFFWHAGLTTGYSAKLGKKDNFRMEFSLGIGYADIPYSYYERNADAGLLIWKRDDTQRWIGPTKLKWSFVWMIPMNTDKKSDKKGGKQ